MKFLMVMIICFAEDACTAVFDTIRFETYDQCMDYAVPASQFMRDAYPTSAGEIHCLNDIEANIYKDYIDNGGVPALSFDPNVTEPSI